MVLFDENRAHPLTPPISRDAFYINAKRSSTFALSKSVNCKEIEPIRKPMKAPENGVLHENSNVCILIYSGILRSGF
jgi:hypothetical protein